MDFERDEQWRGKIYYLIPVDAPKGDAGGLYIKHLVADTEKELTEMVKSAIEALQENKREVRRILISQRVEKITSYPLLEYVVINSAKVVK